MIDVLIRNSIILSLDVKINFEFRKGVGITIKNQEKKSYVAIYQTAITYQIALPIDTTCVWSNTITAV